MPKELSKKDVADFRSRILTAATEFYAKGGQDAITMRELAKALDFSPMGLYRYFRDRDEILAALRADTFDRFSAALEAAFARGKDPFARARSVGAAYLAFALDNPNAYRLMFDMGQDSARKYPGLSEASARASHTVTRHVKDLISAGIVHGDADQIGHALWAAAHGVVVLYLAGRLPAGSDVRSLYFDTMRLAFRGARTAPTRQGRFAKAKLVKPKSAVRNQE